MIYLSPPHLGESEAKLLQDVLLSNWIAPQGPHLDQFERAISERTKASFTVGLSSGTAGLHLGLRQLGVGPGDEVITPSFSFIASASPVTFLGATPVFVDSEIRTWNMDPNLLEDAIKDRRALGKSVKAIVLVHAYGMPAMIDDIFNIAQRYDIPILEDAADSLGARYNGKHVGTFARIGVLSFNGNKIITTSSGGAVLCQHEEDAAHIRYLSTQAKSPLPYYEHEEIGYNYRLSNVLAAIGLGQLEQLEARINRRREIFQIYRKLLSRLADVKFNEETEHAFSNRWLTVADFGKIGWMDIHQALRENNIESRPVWKPLHLQKALSGAPMFVNGNSESLFERCLCLPSGSALTDEQLHRIVNIIESSLKS